MRIYFTKKECSQENIALFSTGRAKVKFKSHLYLILVVLANPSSFLTISMEFDLIKTFQTEGNAPLIPMMALKIF